MSISKNCFQKINTQQPLIKKYVKQNPIIKPGFPIDFFLNPENKNMDLKLTINTFQT
jgi:hypothetical protein